MANIKANKKSIIKQENARKRNAAIRSRTRKAIKKVKLATTTDEVRTRNASIAIKELDKAVTKGVFHKNKAARLKSRMLSNLDKKQPTKIR